MRKHRLIFWILIMICCISFQSVLASDEIKTMEETLKNNPENIDLLVKVGKYYHGLGEKGNKQAVEKALDYFHQALVLDEDNDIIKVWYGSTLCLVGRDSLNPLVKYSKVKDGLKYLDEAVNENPDDLEMRLTRAMTTVNLPNSIFKRLEQSIEDFTKLLKRDQDNSGFLPETEKLLVLLNVGIAHKQNGDLEQAYTYWEQVIELAPDSSQAKRAEELLSIYSF